MNFLFINECIKCFKNHFLYTKKNHLKGFGTECAPQLRKAIRKCRKGNQNEQQ